MFSNHLQSVLFWALAGSLTTSAAFNDGGNFVQVRSVPGSSTLETVGAIRRAVHNAMSQRRDTVFKNSTSIEKSWDGAVLFSMSAPVASTAKTVTTVGAEITCVTCYIKGLASVEMRMDSGFNVSQALRNFTSEVGEEIKNITETTVDYVDDYFETVFNNFGDGIDLDDFDFPTLNLTFNVDVPEIPETRLQFGFDDLELYMMLDTVLSAGVTYTFTLFSTNTPIGLSLDSDTFIGVIFAVDLILSTDAEMDISSGIHLKVEDGLALDIPMFAQNVSSITFNGGSFEFLPVTVVSTSGVLKAILRMGVHAGFSIESPPLFIPGVSASGGVEVGVYADLAEFATNITATAVGEQDEDKDCTLRVQQGYEFALGAAAGATVAIGPQSWGPTPNTQLPIFYTTIADVCAISTTRTAAITASTPSIEARQDEGLTTTTLEEEVTYTGVACMSTGLVNCPVSLQTTTKVKTTKTLVTAVPSGVEASFPETTQTTVANLVPFGTNMKSIGATSGSPVSFVPPPPTPTDSDSVTADKPLGSVSGVDTRIIIGAAAGGGGALLVGAIVVVYFCVKRRRDAARARPRIEVFRTSQPHDGGFHTYGTKTNIVTMQKSRP